MKSTTALVAAAALSSTVPANENSDNLESMSQENRSKIFEIILEEADLACGNVSRTFLQGNDQYGDAYWNVMCGSAESYAVRVSFDPVAKNTWIMDCEVLQNLGATCFTKHDY